MRNYYNSIPAGIKQRAVSSFLIFTALMPVKMALIPMISPLFADEPYRTTGQVRQEVAADPSNPKKIMTLVHYLSFDDSRAAREEQMLLLRRCAILTPNDPFVFVRLGDAYYFNGQKKEAREALLRAATLDPRNPRTQELLRELR